MLSFWRFSQRFWQWFWHWAHFGMPPQEECFSSWTSRQHPIVFRVRGLAPGKTFLRIKSDLFCSGRLSYRKSQDNELGSVWKVAGQSSVEAALLLPILLFIVVLLAQPLCLLYTRAHMASAAAEALRVNATTQDATEVTSFIQRRLSAIPKLDIFHTGGPDDWQIEVQGSATKHGSISITGHVKPFPVFYLFVSLAGLTDHEGLKLTVTTSSDVQPSWLEGNYAQWQELWS